jgi:hypothetical protein
MMESPQAEVSVLPMSADEARRAVDAIKGHMESARKLIYDLHQRSGWRALGYGSWRGCVTAEFDQGQRRLYQELAAAEAEVVLHHGSNETVGQIPERQLRPLAPLRDAPSLMREAWDEAKAASNGTPTGRDVQAAVDAVIARRAPLPNQADFLDADEDEEPDDEPARVPPPAQAKHEDDPDRGARRWIGIRANRPDDCGIGLGARPRRGGAATLAGRWEAGKLRAFREQVRAARDAFDRALTELEQIT